MSSASRNLLRHRAALPALAAGATAILYPRRELHAEAPEDLLPSLSNRKSIYDVPTLPPQTDAPTLDAPVVKSPTSSWPSPTDRLTSVVRTVRLGLHGYAVKAEDGVNDVLTSALKLENSFTSTIASLAPSKESGEKLLPNGIYVLVAAMAGSIVTRNRNILLRATVPAAVGLGAGYAVLPVTMRNVGDLAWSYEKRFPALADTHIRVQERVTRFVETGIAHSKMSVGMLEDKVSGVRESVEDWVKKGK